jgi:hypothetical protein
MSFLLKTFESDSPSSRNRRISRITPKRSTPWTGEEPIKSPTTLAWNPPHVHEASYINFGHQSNSSNAKDRQPAAAGVFFRRSSGKVTDYEKAAARLGPFNLMIGAVAASFLPSLTAQQALEYMRTYRPSIYMPAHHAA